jgi:hypothetical protein
LKAILVKYGAKGFHNKMLTVFAGNHRNGLAIIERECPSA